MSDHNQKHWKPTELAEVWGINENLIREWFSSEPGVLTVARPATKDKRRYVTMRIPDSVAATVYQKKIKRLGRAA